MPALYHPPAAADYLKSSWGFKVTANTLAVWRCRGRGPRYHRAGTAIVYSSTELDYWALERVEHCVPDCCAEHPGAQ